MKRVKSMRFPLPILDAFDVLYGVIPEIECKGLCAESCGMAPMSAFEWQRLVARHGKVPVSRTAGDCPFLKDGKCEHHDIRPVICRLWGQVEGMVCPHGCAKTLMPEADAFGVVATADRIGGGPVSDQMEIVFASNGK
jgi:hypothetical protein